ncbi:NADH-quinone oxidoreductase subunit J [bacterium]|nr:NADH-quinone oxidoreductase subunit J [bacterium]
MILGGAVAVLFSRIVIRAVVYLLVSLFGVAALYILLRADFLAAVQVLVYIGGITVLMVFGVMLTGAGRLDAPPSGSWKAFYAGVSSLALLALLGIVVGRTTWPTGGILPEEGSTSILGELFLRQHVMAFEVASVLLLVVLVGVALFIRLGRRKVAV